jgi:hypothetical protein
MVGHARGIPNERMWERSLRLRLCRTTATSRPPLRWCLSRQPHTDACQDPLGVCCGGDADGANTSGAHEPKPTWWDSGPANLYGLVSIRILTFVYAHDGADTDEALLVVIADQQAALLHLGDIDDWEPARTRGQLGETADVARFDVYVPTQSTQASGRKLLCSGSLPIRSCNRELLL